VISIGIDPGTRRLGWGVVRRVGNKLEHLAHGVLRMDVETCLAERLAFIDAGLRVLIEDHHPDVASVETLYFDKDPQAAAKLGHARGVVLAAFARAGVEVAEYAPSHVKRTVAGRGDASKDQVALMVRALLGLEALPPRDASDALAMALTHLRAGPVGLLLRERAPTARRVNGRQKLAALVRAQRGE
jgi:crossover junction endodeoxyribonuclease RuvC